MEINSWEKSLLRNQRLKNRTEERHTEKNVSPVRDMLLPGLPVSAKKRTEVLGAKHSGPKSHLCIYEDCELGHIVT